LNIRAFVKSLVPPILVRALVRILRLELRFSDQPTSWADALAMSSGYSDDDILDRVTQATRAVVSGKASFERDSVLFYKHDYRFPVLASVLRAAALNGGQLEVVDFGGSLGSTYLQCRPLLNGLSRIDWWIVEQPKFVAAGRREFTTTELHFAETTLGVPKLSAESMVLACGVLQYVERPFAILDELGRLDGKHMTIDRLPLSDALHDRLCIQHTPKSIYSASYPCWIFSRSHLMAYLSKKWHVICDFACEEGLAKTDDGLRFEFRGMILERKA
jgi:putative methyltransferase (TIGR04325 family)